MAAESRDGRVDVVIVAGEKVHRRQRVARHVVDHTTAVGQALLRSQMPRCAPGADAPARALRLLRLTLSVWALKIRSFPPFQKLLPETFSAFTCLLNLLLFDITFPLAFFAGGNELDSPAQHAFPCETL